MVRVVAVTWQDVATNPENEWQTSIVVEVSRDRGLQQPGLDASGSPYGSATERQIDDLQRTSLARRFCSSRTKLPSSYRHPEQHLRIRRWHVGGRSVSHDGQQDQGAGLGCV